MSRTFEVLQLRRERRAAVQAFDFDRAQFLSERLASLSGDVPPARRSSGVPPEAPEPADDDLTPSLDARRSRYDAIVASVKRRHESQ
jgi:hypothetical protein